MMMMIIMMIMMMMVMMLTVTMRMMMMMMMMVMMMMTMMVIMANIFPRWLIPRRPFLPRGFPAKRRVVLWGLEGPETDDWEAGLEGLEARHASSREMALGTGGS